MSKPRSITTNLVLSPLLAALGWTFFTVFTLKKPDSELLPLIRNAATVYTAMAPVIVFGALRRNVWAMRVGWAVNLGISLPPKAVIGIVFALIGVGLSFTASAKEYFAAA